MNIIINNRLLCFTYLHFSRRFSTFFRTWNKWLWSWYSVLIRIVFTYNYVSSTSLPLSYLAYQSSLRRIWTNYKHYLSFVFFESIAIRRYQMNIYRKHWVILNKFSMWIMPKTSALKNWSTRNSYIEKPNFVRYYFFYCPPIMKLF